MFGHSLCGSSCYDSQVSTWVFVGNLITAIGIDLSARAPSRFVVSDRHVWCTSGHAPSWRNRLNCLPYARPAALTLIVPG